MQLMATRGLEHGETPGFDWIGGEVVRLAPRDPALKVPHMGWNELVIDRAHPLLEGIADGRPRLFRPLLPPAPAATRRIAWRMSTMASRSRPLVARGNVAGTQFHPEKSQATGLRLIANFLRWRP